MKKMTTFGTLAGVLLLTIMVSSSTDADPTTIQSPEYFIILPYYDATGTWDVSTKLGWTNCDKPILADFYYTWELKQTGSNFNVYIPNTEYRNGSVSGRNYHYVSSYHTSSSLISYSFVWALESSLIGNGYRTEIYSSDAEGIICSTNYELHITKKDLCTPTDTRMCLQNGRFTVRVSWEDEHGNTGDGHAVPTTEDSGLFWFFSKNNMELLIKVLDGCSVNNRYWVFFAATTDQKFTVRVTDLETDEQAEYTNPLKNPADAVTDTSAFATCP